MAAQGYPGTPTKGTVIEGLDAAAGTGAMVFHASTARDAEGRIIANGGRVLNVTALGATVGEAQAAAYRAVDSIRWPGGFCRRSEEHPSALQSLMRRSYAVCCLKKTKNT